MMAIWLAGIAALGIGTAFAAANPDGSAAQTTNGRANPLSQTSSPQQATAVPLTTRADGIAHRRQDDRIISKFYR